MPVTRPERHRITTSEEFAGENLPSRVMARLNGGARLRRDNWKETPLSFIAESSVSRDIGSDETSDGEGIRGARANTKFPRAGWMLGSSRPSLPRGRSTTRELFSRCISYLFIGGRSVPCALVDARFWRRQRLPTPAVGVYSSCSFFKALRFRAAASNRDRNRGNSCETRRDGGWE